MVISEGWKTDDWYSWWIVGDKLIDVGPEMSGGDHYATLYIVEDPSVFGLNQSEVSAIKRLWKDDGPTDPDKWMNIVQKVLKKNVRLGVNHNELFLDIPTEDDTWIHAVQAHRDKISKVKPNRVTIEITSKRDTANPVDYIGIPIDDFWSAEKLSDLRAYRNV